MGIGLLALGFLIGGSFRADLPDFFHPFRFRLAEADWPLTEAGDDDGKTDDGVPPVTDRPVLVPLGPALDGTATRYGTSYTGERLGCGTAVYSSTDETIIAVGPSRDGAWRCGTVFEVCGHQGCIVGVRKDGCPGCGPSHLDLSEAGIAKVCGPGADSCRVRIQVMKPAP